MIHGIKVLLVLRDKGTLSFDELCRALHVKEPSAKSSLDETLARLLRAKLIASNLACDFDIRSDGWFEITDTWRQLQNAIGFSLTKQSLLVEENALVVRPFYTRPDSRRSPQKVDVFVIMPFSESLRSIYDNPLKAAARRLGLSIARADDFFTAHGVMQDIFWAIQGATLVVAECTGRNPNVFYEAGIAHALGVPVILITQKADDVPSDLQPVRFVRYTDTPSGLAQLESHLTKTMSTILNK